MAKPEQAKAKRPRRLLRGGALSNEPADVRKHLRRPLVVGLPASKAKAMGRVTTPRIRERSD